MDIAAGRLNEEIVNSFFDGENVQVKTVEVLLRPQVWIHQLNHGKERTAVAPGIVTPLVTSALLNREGFLFPISPTTIPRDLLEPLHKGTFSIGEMTDYNKFKTTHDSTNFGTGDEDEDEDEQYEETDEQRAERYARYQQWGQKYLKDTDELLKYCWHMARIT